MISPAIRLHLWPSAHSIKLRVRSSNCTASTMVRRVTGKLEAVVTTRAQDPEARDGDKDSPLPGWQACSR
jgi:hypothetical protein